MSDSSLPKNNRLSSFEESNFAEWLSENGKTIGYLVLAIIASLVLIFTYVNSRNGQAEQDYLQAANEFNTFVKAGTINNAPVAQEALDRLESLMNKHPELHSAYDGIIAQILLEMGMNAKADPIAKATIARTKNEDLPFYNDYASTTLLISSQNYIEALKNAQNLQQQMITLLNKNDEKQTYFGEELFALNLLRIGMLQRQVGDPNAELTTWKEWKQYMGLENSETLPAKVNPQVFRSVVQQLAVGTVSLPDYIAYREKILKGLK